MAKNRSIALTRTHSLILPLLQVERIRHVVYSKCGGLSQPCTLLLLVHGTQARTHARKASWTTAAGATYVLMYVEISIWSGSSGMFTSKRDCTFASISVSSSDEMKLIDSPFVPNRPARPTRWRYWSLSFGKS